MGVSRSTVQRYCDLGILKPHKTLGGHRRVRAEDVADWMKQNRSTKRRRIKTKPFRAEKFTAGYVADALLDGKLKRLDGLLDQVLLGNQYISWLFDNFLAPAMWDIGNRWSQGNINYPDERRATSNLKHFLRSASRTFEVVANAPTAVGGSLEGDHSELGSMMIEILLREANYDAFHIGANIPAQTIGDIATQMDADMVWISHCHIPCRSTLIEQNRIIRNAVPTGCKLIIGGYALDDDLLQTLEYDFFGKQMSDFRDFVVSDAMPAEHLLTSQQID